MEKGEVLAQTRRLKRGVKGFSNNSEKRDKRALMKMAHYLREECREYGLKHSSLVADALSEAIQQEIKITKKTQHLD
ncbi:MAG: hypothetical protein PVF65_03050 [Sphingomonadales bacterium]